MNNSPFASDEEIEMVFEKIFLLFRDVLNAAKCEVPENDIREYAAGLAVKIFRQVCTFKMLQNGSPIPYDDPEQGNWDTASIACVTRSMLEAYLIFHWIFMSSESDEEKEFKYFVWIMGSLIDRLETYPIDVYERLKANPAVNDLPDVPKIFENDRKEIENIRQKLEKNKFYIEEILPLKNTDKRKQRYQSMVKDGWYPGSWKHLQEAIPAFHNKRIHQMLSGTVHSSYYHIRQVNRAKTADEQKALCKTEIVCTTIIMARLSLEYTEIFPHASEAYENHELGLAFAKEFFSKE